MFCRARHGNRRELCLSCGELWTYAKERTSRCPLLANKPTCLNCSVHCYNNEMRERIREVMRCAGPRMLFRHPVLAVWHLIDGRREK